MKKTVILIIFVVFLGGAIGWLIKGQVSSDTKADKQETIAQEASGQESDGQKIDAQEEGKQESGGQEAGAQEIVRQESGEQEIGRQGENKQETDEGKTNEKISYNDLERDKMLQQAPIGKIEYPLKDLRFDVNKKYRIVLTDNTTGKVVKEYTDQGEFFKANKKEFSVMVSSGKNENSPYLLSIYEGKDCIKEIAYMALGNDMIGDKWVTID